MSGKKLFYIENEGAIFRGPSRSFPTEVWTGGDKDNFEPYKGKTPKPVEWGDIISEAEAHEFMDEINGVAGKADQASAE